MENALAIQVSDANYDKKSKPFQRINSDDLLEFPKLTVEDLELMLTGSFQLKQAIEYLGEMLDKDNNLSIRYLKQDSNIVRYGKVEAHQQ